MIIVYLEWVNARISRFLSGAQSSCEILSRHGILVVHTKCLSKITLYFILNFNLHFVNLRIVTRFCFVVIDI